LLLLVELVVMPILRCSLRGRPERWVRAEEA
jgi:hypothetical protein